MKYLANNFIMDYIGLVSKYYQVIETYTLQFQSNCSVTELKETLNYTDCDMHSIPTRQ